METGFLANNLEKAYRMTQVLRKISSFDTEGYLALRGGTAINFCYPIRNGISYGTMALTALVLLSLFDFSLSWSSMLRKLVSPPMLS